MKRNVLKKFLFKKKPIWSILLVVLFFGLTNCATQDSKNSPLITNIRITPTPVKLLYKRGYFRLDKSTKILMDLSDQKSKRIGEYILRELKSKTRYKLKIADRFTVSKIESTIEIITTLREEIKPEGYKIEIKKDKIIIYAIDDRGLLYAVNTTLDLLKKANNKKWIIPQLYIEDYPSTSFRGLFFKKDLTSENKSNLLDWAIRNRINNLIIKNTDVFNYSRYVEIHLASKFKTVTSSKKSIKKYYNTIEANNDTLIFTVFNKNTLHPDSLAILGEAMWSKKNKRKYAKIIDYLGNRIKK